MQRNWDTVRLILTKLEDKKVTPHYLTLEDFEDIDAQKKHEISFGLSKEQYRLPLEMMETLRRSLSLLFRIRCLVL